MMMKRVSVFWCICASMVQNRSTLASSQGASTSSRTHTGAGLVRNTAKIKAIAVKACSPPDIKLICSIFLPGGQAKISSPASSGSSDSVSRNSASPPLNSVYILASSKFEIYHMRQSDVHMKNEKKIQSLELIIGHVQRKME